MRYYLLVLKILNFLLFIWIIMIFTDIFNFDNVVTNQEEELVFTDVIASVRNIIIYIIYWVLYMIGYISSFATSLIFRAFPLYDGNFMFLFQGFFFKYFVGSWFSFPHGDPPSLWEIPALVGEEIRILTTDLYLLTFFILYFLAWIFAIRAIVETNTRNNLMVIGCLVLMVVIPLVIFGFRDMLRLFTLRIPYFEDLQNPVDPKLTELPLDDFFAFMASTIALFAIIAYIYLEISFQIEYTDVVTKPSLERNDRLEAQLSILQKESQIIFANAEKIQEEAKRIREEMKIDQKESIGGFFARAGQRFSYVKEMIERRKLEEEEKRLVTAASKTRRLGRYIERIFREDPEARDTITAKSSAPKSQSLAVSTAFNFSYRVALLIILSFIIIHPHWFFVNVFNLPPAITESVAMYSPEVVITLMVPFMLLFPVIAYIISYVKHRNLIIRLKQEGRIKEILASVGDYVVKTEEETEEKSEEGSEPAASEAA